MTKTKKRKAERLAAHPQPPAAKRAKEGSKNGQHMQNKPLFDQQSPRLQPVDATSRPPFDAGCLDHHDRGKQGNENGVKRNHMMVRVQNHASAQPKSSPMHFPARQESLHTQTYSQNDGAIFGPSCPQSPEARLSSSFAPVSDFAQRAHQSIHAPSQHTRFSEQWLNMHGTRSISTTLCGQPSSLSSIQPFSMHGHSSMTLPGSEAGVGADFSLMAQETSTKSEEDPLTANLRSPSSATSLSQFLTVRDFKIIMEHMAHLEYKVQTLTRDMDRVQELYVKRLAVLETRVSALEPYIGYDVLISGL